MLKKNHLTWTFALSLWIFYYISNENIIKTVIYSSITALLSWLPDIDLKIVSAVSDWNKKSLFLLYPFYVCVKFLFRHRTTTHTIWIPLILMIIAHNTDYYVIKVGILILALALILHIFEDSLTQNGVEPFLPIPIKIRFWNFSTTSHIHYVVLEFLAFLIGTSFFLTKVVIDMSLPFI